MPPFRLDATLPTPITEPKAVFPSNHEKVYLATGSPPFTTACTTPLGVEQLVLGASTTIATATVLSTLTIVTTAVSELHFAVL